MGTITKYIGRLAGFDDIQVKDIVKGKSFAVVYKK